MNTHEAERIAAAMNMLRPDWPKRQLDTLLAEKLMDRPRRDVVVALAWVASESGTANPYRVLESGPWWLAAGVAGDTTGRREPYDASAFCDLCNKPTNRHAGSDHVFVSAVDHARRLNAEDDATSASKDAAREYARQAIGDAKAPAGPTPEAERVASENVDRLRAAKAEPVTEGAA